MERGDRFFSIDEINSLLERDEHESEEELDKYRNPYY
jgi:hypothetical protein